MCIVKKVNTNALYIDIGVRRTTVKVTYTQLLEAFVLRNQNLNESL